MSDQKPVVLITAPFVEEIALSLSSTCEVILRPSLADGMSLASSEHREFLTRAEVVITEIDLVDEASLELSPRLSMVVSCRAMPVNVDVVACEKKSVTVKTTPGRNADVTADFAFGLLLSTVRKVSQSEAWMRTLRWQGDDLYFPYREFRGMALNGKTLGIVGGGAIGRRMAERARGFGMNRLVYDPFLTQEQLGDLGKRAELDELMSNSDIVTIHAPLMESTIGLISEREIRRMKTSAFLINAGRAAIVDRDALFEALQERRIAGAGIDVYWEEPPAPDDLVYALSNLTITPHVAGASDDVVAEHSRLAVAHVRQWLAEKEK